MTFHLEQETAARVPDGTRPLTVAGARPSRSLLPSYVDPVNGVERTCYSVLHDRAFPDYGRPANCRQQIVRGDHYLIWVQLDMDARPTGYRAAYCAPCAVTEWASVTETGA